MVRVSLLSLTLFLSACGGSGGSSNDTPPPVTPPPAATTLTIQGDTEANQNQSVAIIAMLNADASAYKFTWTQTSGPALELLTANSQVLSFDAPSPGEYGFSVSVSDQNGAVRFQDTHTLMVNNQVHNATVRLDHVVSESAKVSFRADAIPQREIISISWQQTAGQTVPQSNFTATDDEQFLFFDAPLVSADQILQFRATMTLDNGDNITDEVYLLVRNVASNEDGFFPGSAERIVTTEMHAYNSNSPYASALESCVYNNSVGSSCRFSTLPLLGQVSDSPDIDDVMDRVLVSHQWMGDRLKSYLENSVAAQDMLLLFRGVTAIIISYDVRPSFYWVATGAIYLDADNFWVTPEERDTLNDVPDFRSAFGADLQFIMPWRYVKDNQSYLARAAYPRQQRLSRTFEDLEADITWLMYHELAHANDYFPPDRWQDIPSSSDPLAYYNVMAPDSTSFASFYPLTSEQLKALAQVSFAGETATTEQRNVTDVEAAEMFQNDRAAMYYSYSSIREDYATLFERFMMAYRFGAEADTAVMKVRNENPDLIVTWGQRSRINDPSLLNRTRQVVRNIYPDLDVDAIQPTLPAAQELRAGETWEANLNLEDSAERANKHPLRRSPAEQFPAHMQHYLHQGRPVIPGEGN